VGKPKKKEKKIYNLHATPITDSISERRPEKKEVNEQ
jgi:hypothetical protein